jgi:hypothetical protein
MGVHTYRIKSPDTYEGLKEKVLEAQKSDGYLEIDGEETGDELQARRGSEIRNRHFQLFLSMIQPIPDDYLLLGQDTKTHEWATIHVQGNEIVMIIY